MFLFFEIAFDLLVLPLTFTPSAAFLATFFLSMLLDLEFFLIFF
jgi:hypothetical protein